MEVKIMSSSRPLQIQTSAEGRSPSNIVTPASTHPLTVLTSALPAKPSGGPKNGLTPSELLHSVDLFSVVVFTLLVVLTALFCIVTEDSIPLIYVLPLVALLSIAFFHYMKL